MNLISASRNLRNDTHVDFSAILDLKMDAIFLKNLKNHTHDNFCQNNKSTILASNHLENSTHDDFFEIV